MLDATGGPGHYASQDPKDDPNQEYEVILGPRQVAREDVDHRDQTADQAYIKPPHHPVVNSQVVNREIHVRSLSLHLYDGALRAEDSTGEAVDAARQALPLQRRGFSPDPYNSIRRPF